MKTKTKIGVQVDSPWLDTDDAGTYLGGIPRGTLVKWRTRRIGPKFSRIGKHVRYNVADLDAWAVEQSR